MPSSPASSKTRVMPASFAFAVCPGGLGSEASDELPVGEPMQRAELRGVVAAGAGRHASTLEHGDARALALEQERGGESNDSRSEHGHVHAHVVLERRTLRGASRPGTRVSRSRAEAYPVCLVHTPGHELPGVRPRAASLTCLLALALAGCGATDRERDAGAAAQRFHSALEHRDGRPMRLAQQGDGLEARAAGAEAVCCGDPVA